MKKITTEEIPEGELRFFFFFLNEISIPRMIPELRSAFELTLNCYRHLRINISNSIPITIKLGQSLGFAIAFVLGNALVMHYQ